MKRGRKPIRPTVKDTETLTDPGSTPRIIMVRNCIFFREEYKDVVP